MTWTRPDPLGAGMAAAGSFLTAQQAGKKDAAEAARQAELDRAAASTAAVDNAYKTAETKHIGFEESASTTAATNAAIQQHLENVDSGYGVIPPEAPVQKPGGPPPTARQWSDYYAKYAASLARTGSLKGTKTASDLATSWGTQASKEEAAALAVKTQAEKALQDLATRNHWNREDLQKAKDELGRMLREAQHNGTSLEVAAMNGVNAMARTVYTQGHEDTRSALNRGAKGSGKKTTAGERDTESYNTANAGLTPQGKSFMSMLYGTNNQPTKAQALQALDQSRLSPGDKANARTIIESKQSQFVTPGSQVTGARADANSARTGAISADKFANLKGEQLYHAIQTAPAFAPLSPRAKSFVHTALVGYGMDVPAAIAAVNASNNPDKAAILQALGGP